MLAKVRDTSVEAERVFSVCGQFDTKIRNGLNAKYIDALCSLKVHFQRKNKLMRVIISLFSFI